MKNEIVMYQPDSTVQLEVALGDDTVWLTLDQMAELFGRNKSTISRHIKNIYSEEELHRSATVAFFATVQIEGDRSVSRQVEHFNLDVIISVGYRVKSKLGVHFRQWATGVLREYLLKGHAVNPRFERLEYRMGSMEEKFELFIRTAQPPKEGALFEGQIFDAHELVSRLVKSAEERIILIDNYIDESVLSLLTKRKDGVEASVFTGRINKALQLDIDKHNAQYPAVNASRISGVHDRFLIIDDDLYFIGASIKDLGRKLFAFSKMEISAEEILAGCKVAR